MHFSISRLVTEEKITSSDWLLKQLILYLGNNTNLNQPSIKCLFSNDGETGKIDGLVVHSLQHIKE